MKKSVIATAWAIVVCLPCFLVFDAGADAPDHESLGWTNIVGLLWAAFLVMGGFKWITPESIMKELCEMIGDE